jgi:hypothetical protein
MILLLILVGVGALFVMGFAAAGFAYLVVVMAKVIFGNKKALKD